VTNMAKGKRKSTAKKASSPPDESEPVPEAAGVENEQETSTPTDQDYEPEWAMYDAELERHVEESDADTEQELSQDLGVQTSVTEKELASDKVPRFFPVRLGFLSFMFLAFFTISVLILNIASIIGLVTNGDIFHQVLTIIQTPMERVPVLLQIFNFIVPFSNIQALNPNADVQALYISAGFVLTFMTLSLLSTKHRVTHFLFEGSAIKRFFAQLGTFFLLFILYIQALKLYVDFFPDTNDYGIAADFLAIGATAWILFQGYALLTAARRNGTRVEGALVKQGRLAYAFAIILPVFVIVFILLLTWGYFVFLGLLTLIHISAPSWPVVIEVILGAMLVFCLLPTFIVAATRSSRRRQKVYDNLVIQLTNFFMFPYLLFNITIYYILPKTQSSGTSTSTGLLSQIFLYADLVVTIVMLLMALRSASARTGYRFGPLNKHSFILFIYASLAGQFGIRYLQSRPSPLPSILGSSTSNNIFLDGQYWVVDAVVVALMLFYVLAFGSRKFGLYFRVRDQVSRQDHQRIDFIHEYLLEEYARRNGMFLVAEMYDALATLMKVDTFKAMQLVEKMRVAYSDIRIEGVKKRYIVLVEDKKKDTKEA